MAARIAATWHIKGFRMIIYIVTSGECEDYSIEAIFSNSEAAEAFCATLKYPWENRVEGWELDDPKKGLENV